MYDETNNFSKEEIFRMYDQSELSDFINIDKTFYKKIKGMRTHKEKFTFCYSTLGAGIIAGAAGFLLFLRKYKLIRFF